MDISELFPAGPILSEERQIGRVPAIEALAARIRAGDVTRIFDRRRWGKSSVARAALARLESDGLIARRLPLDEYPTSEAAATFLASAFASPAARAVKSTRSLGSRIADPLRRAGQTLGSPETSLMGELLAGLGSEQLTLQRVLELIPEELARTSKRAALAIDEAHIIAKWSEQERAALRAFFARDDRQTGVVLASSEASAEETLKQPEILGYLGEHFQLAPIAEDDWRHGLRERFDHADVPIAPNALDLLLDESRGHPYCTMLLAKHAAELGLTFGEVTLSVVQVALPTVREHEAWKLR
jgi:hypothetical protein